MNDLRFAFRQLAKSPGFTIVAVLTLALGIGANTAIFSVVNGLLLKPLRYPDPDRLVTLWESSPERGLEQDRVSGPNYLDWRAQNTVFEELAVTPAWHGVQNFNIILRDGTMKANGAYASASLFSVLGVKPLLGRTLLPEEDRKEGNRAAVLSYGLWQRLFEGNSNVIGQTLTVDTYGRREYQIVGVMPPGFGEPGRTEFWLPIGWMDVSLTERRSAHWHQVIGRLKPGVSVSRAQAELSAIQARIKQAHSGETIGSSVVVVPMVQQALGRNFRTGLLIFSGVVAGVLLIACANLANLLLARGSARQKEIAVRLSLGASRWRIVRQLLAESVVLAVAGGLAGVLLSRWAIQLFIAVAPAEIPRLDQLTLDLSALLFTLSLSVLTGISFGLAPAWQLSRPALVNSLKDEARGASSGPAATRTRSALIIGEVALSLVLLVLAALMLQSFVKMLRADRGFQAEHLVTAELDFSVSGFTTWVQPAATRPQVPLQILLERIRSLPGVQSAGASSGLLRRDNAPAHEAFTAFGWPAYTPEDQPKAHFMAVTPDWLRALSGRLLQGRDLAESDSLQAPGAVLVNETLAKRFFPGRDPIGERVKMGAAQPPLGSTNRWGITDWSTIVGVISDVKSLHAHPQAGPEIYVSYWQWPMVNPVIFVRASGDPASLDGAIRREVKAVLPNLPPPVIRTMTDLLDDSIAQPRLQTGLLGVFAGIAILLAAIGLYGVLSGLVVQRTREIGVRMALGASRRNVLSLVAGHGMKLALAGVILGMAAALAVTRVLRSLLYEVSPSEPLAYVAVSGLLLLVALLSCALPAWRASRVDPMEALRTE